MGLDDGMGWGPVDVVLVVLLAAAPPPPPGGALFLFLDFFLKKRKKCASSGEHEQYSEALAQAARERRVHSNAFLVRRSRSARLEIRGDDLKKRDQPLGPGPHI